MKLIEDALDKLTDNYNKAKNSNIGKLFKLLFEQLQEVKEVLDRMESWQNIDQAEGKVLDRLARRVKEERGQKEDEVFRDYIKLRVRTNRSAGEIETINEIGRVFIGESYAGVEELWCNSSMGNEPAALLVTFTETVKPLPSIAVERVVAGGVRVYWQFHTKPSELVIETNCDTVLYPYWMCGTFLCGVNPQPVNEGIDFEIDIQTLSEGVVNDQFYPLTGTFLAGRNSFIGEVEL